MAETEIAGQLRRMCCPGCAAAASLIESAGLGDYYRYRDELSPRVDADRDNDFAAYDDPALQAEFVHFRDDGRCQAMLSVDGMVCAACAWLLEHYLGRVDGVGKVSIILNEQRLNIEFNPELTPMSRIMAATQELGYRPRPYRATGEATAAAVERRRYLLRLGVAGLVMMQLGMFAVGLYAGAFQGIESNYRELLRWASLLLALPVVGFAATPFFVGAWRGLRSARPGMDLPVALAIGIAFLASCINTWRGDGEIYFDSVAMFTFFLLLARFLEMRSRRHAGLAATGLLGSLPDVVRRLDEKGEVRQLPLLQIRPGDRILVPAGEIIPADGVLRRGSGGINEASISGESLPVHHQPGDSLTAGTLSVDAVLEIEVTATGLDSRLGSILRLVDRAQEEKPAIAAVADRIAGGFVIGVLLLAALTALYWAGHDTRQLIPATLAVLVVSCPCALSLATPVALTGATTTLKRLGFLVTRGHALEALAGISRVLFDKTGTLTSGQVVLLETRTLGTQDAGQARRLAAALESRSEHPLAAAFANIEGPFPEVESVRVAPGRGIEASIKGRRHRIGTLDYVVELSAQAALTPPEAGKWVLLGAEHGALAWFRLGDSLRPSAADAVAGLRVLGIAAGIASGDSPSEVARIAADLGLSEHYSALLPEDKLDRIRALQASGERVLAVGDGINDLPVLAGANVSVAVASAADISKTQADCLLLNPDLGRINDAISLARRARRIVAQNLGWALLYNLLAIPFAAAGLVPPWLAAIGMSGSSLLVVSNASRLRKV